MRWARTELGHVNGRVDYMITHTHAQYPSADLESVLHCVCLHQPIDQPPWIPGSRLTWSFEWMHSLCEMRGSRSGQCADHGVIPALYFAVILANYVVKIGKRGRARRGQSPLHVQTTP